MAPSRSIITLAVFVLAAFLPVHEAFLGLTGVRCRAPGATARRVARGHRAVMMAKETADEPRNDWPQMPQGAAPAVAEPQQADVEDEDEDLTEEEKAAKANFERIEALRAKEVFEKKATGDFECQVCGWKYEEVEGYGQRIRPGTPFAEVPGDFKCPKCKAPKSAFAPVTVTIAGFTDNRNYGLGGNSLTGEQKSGLIFGSLVFFFFLFLSGYLLE